MKSIIPKISVIVPVHNAGERFIKCMDTLLNQTLHDIEIILVLDCPTDGTDKIAKEYAAKDNRIIIIENKTNLHIGNSRNEGIKIARGEYIGFSDHDDYRELTMYEELYKAAQKNDYDVVLGKNVSIEDNVKKGSFVPSESNEELLKSLIKRDIISGGDEITFTPLFANIHPNIYKTSFIKEHNITFVDTRNVTPEDRIFQTMCLLNSDNFTFYNKALYYHILYKNSAVNSRNYISIHTRMNGKKVVYDFLIEKNLFEQYKDAFYHSVKKEFTNSVLIDFFEDKKLDDLVESIKEMKKLSFTKEAFSKATYSLKKFRLGGRISRWIIIQWMKI